MIDFERSVLVSGAFLFSPLSSVGPQRKFFNSFFLYPCCCFFRYPLQLLLAGKPPRCAFPGLGSCTKGREGVSFSSSRSVGHALFQRPVTPSRPPSGPWTYTHPASSLGSPAAFPVLLHRHPTKRRSASSVINLRRRLFWQFILSSCHTSRSLTSVLPKMSTDAVKKSPAPIWTAGRRRPLIKSLNMSPVILPFSSLSWSR